MQLVAVFIAFTITSLGFAKVVDSTDAATKSGTLRVMVWNALHGANDVTQGAEKALKIIRETKPDVVLLQYQFYLPRGRHMHQYHFDLRVL